MLTPQVSENSSEVRVTSFALVASIILGVGIGTLSPKLGASLGNYLDHTLIALVSLLFFGVRWDALSQLAQKHNLYFVGIALVANFVLLPVIGYAVASVFLADYPLLMVGLVIYFMAPCTDWFLSFTRMSQGNVALGSTLIPINMLVQLLLYPVYLQVFAGQAVQIELSTIGFALVQWFLLPLVLAVVLRQALKLLLKPHRTVQFNSILSSADNSTMWLTALLVLQVFGANVPTIREHLGVFIWLLLAVVTFFVLNWLLSHTLSKVFRLRFSDYALLAMTMASRNAPLMLAVTIVVIPDQPMIYGALVVGMLVEIPHLTLLRHLLLRRAESTSAGDLEAQY
ncbi:MAG: arsenic resistance protein [Pseudomonadota bacterium]